MTTPLIVLPFSFGGGPVLDMSRVAPMLSSSREPGAVGHWLFGEDNPDFLDVVSSQPLVPATTTPALHSGYAQTTGSPHDGLQSPYVIGANLSWCAVVKKVTTAGGYQMVGGHNDSGAQYQSIFVFPEGYYAVTYAGVSGTPPGGDIGQAMPIPAGIDDGDWMFMALCHSATQRRDFIGAQAGNHYAATRTVTHDTLTDEKLFVGSNHPATNRALAIAEFLVFEGYPSEAELLGIYGRSRQRLAARGIEVK